MQNIRTLFSPRDMTQGAPWKRILEFSIPMLLGNFAQQLYNTVDSIVVGQYVGSNALAAVGRAGPMLNFLLALLVGIAAGAGILVSQYFGAKDRERLSLAIGNCLTLTAIVSLVVSLLGIFLARPLMRLLNTPEEIMDWSVQYIQILFMGITGSIYYNILAGVLRGMGDSLSALGFLLLATILNIVLDLWFVISFQWGVGGVALATVLSQSISAVLCFMKLRRMKDTFLISRNTLKLQKDMVLDMTRLGLPTGITQAIFSVAMILVQPLQNSYGADYLAMSTIIIRVDGFAMLPSFSFAQAMTTYIGQNVGGCKEDRLHLGARQGIVIAVCVVAALTAAILIFGREIMGLFLDDAAPNREYIITNGMKMMRILSLGYLGMAFLQALSGIMRGAGDTWTPMVISVLISVVLRVPLSYLLINLTRSAEHPNGAEEALFIVLTIVWCTGALINWFAYRRGKWRLRAQERMNMMCQQSSDMNG